MGAIISRFAPAPTGFLHLGHVVNAIYVWETADRVILRIEDHDRQRCRKEFDAAILEDLAWLGFVAEGAAVRQSERGDIYTQALEVLKARGIVYACSCARTLPYPGTCRERGLSDAHGFGLRVRFEPTVERFVDLRHGAQEQRPSEQCGDLLIRDRAGNWTYHFAATVDDYVQGVTHVIRGDDLLDSTGRQLQLSRLLGRVEPPQFLHHPLIMKSPTQKLSKSDGDTGVRDLRARGWTARDVIARARELSCRP